MACQPSKEATDELESGVSSALAKQRASQLQNIHYQLFFNIPNSLSAAIPYFDQPDIKGRYRLPLEVPAEWSAVGIGALGQKTRRGGRSGDRGPADWGWL